MTIFIYIAQSLDGFIAGKDGDLTMTTLALRNLSATLMLW